MILAEDLKKLYFLSHLEIEKDATSKFCVEDNNIFHVKDLIKFTFYVKLINVRKNP